MTSIKKKAKSISILDYLAVLFIIISSGTAFFYMYNAGLTIISFFLFSCIYAVYRGCKLKFNYYIVTYFCLIAINTVIHGVNIIVIGYLLFLISTLLITTSISFNLFRRAMLNVVLCLCCISILLEILFWLNIIVPSLYGNGKNGLWGHYIFAFHVFGGGQWGLSYRLSGIFWEPGIYQMILNMTLIFNLDIFEKSLHINHRKFKLSLIIISIVLTASTTGYLILGFIIIGRTIIKSRDSIKYKFFLLFASLLFMCSFIVVPVIANKFSEDNPSYLIRLNDIIGLFKAMWINPYIGLGVNSKTFEHIAFRLGIISQSAGLLQQSAQLGLFWTTAFYYSSIKEFKKRKIKLPLYIFLIELTMLGMGEPLTYSPLMLLNTIPFKKY